MTRMGTGKGLVHPQYPWISAGGSTKVPAHERQYRHACLDDVPIIVRLVFSSLLYLSSWCTFFFEPCTQPVTTNVGNSLQVRVTSESCHEPSHTSCIIPEFNTTGLSIEKSSQPLWQNSSADQSTSCLGVACENPRETHQKRYGCQSVG